MVKKKSFKKRLKHFLEYILVYSVYAVFKNLSIDNASMVGGFIAKIITFFGPGNKIAHYNIKMCFPALSDVQIKNMISSMWDNLCRTAAEMPHIHSMSEKEFLRRVEIVGEKEMLARDKSSAGICVSSHMGNWEVAARVTLRYNDKVSIVYRKMNKSLMNDTYISMRQGKFTNIPKGSEGVKKIIEVIKNGNLVCLLPDQFFDKGVEANFFGMPALTAKAPMGLALKYNLTICFGYCVRKKGANFRVYISKPWNVRELVPDLDQCDDPELALTEKMNEIIESWVRKDPSQWCWIHHRWGKDIYRKQ